MSSIGARHAVGSVGAVIRQAGRAAAAGLFALCGLAAAMTSEASAQPGAALEIVGVAGEAGPPIARFTLPNGLRGVVVEDRRAPAVSVTTYYGVGAADDPVGLSGRAALLERLASRSDAAPGAARALARAGARAQSDLAYDHIAFSFEGPARALETLLRIEADRMSDLSLDEAAVAQARASLRAASVDAVRRAGVGGPSSALFESHPYRRPLLGWPQEVAAIGFDDVADAADAFFAPDHALVVVSGDVSLASAYAAVEAAFGDAAPSGAVRPERLREPPTPAAVDRLLVLSDARAARSLVRRVTRLDAPAASGPGEIAGALLLAAVLGDAGEGRLAAALGGQRAVALGADAEVDLTLRDFMLFSISAAPAEAGLIGRASNGLRRALRSLAVEGPTAQELDRAQAVVSRDLALARARRGDLAALIGRGGAAGLSLERVLGLPAAVASATAEDVRRAARRVLTEPSVTIATQPAPADVAADFERPADLDVDRGADGPERVVSRRGVEAWLLEDASAPVLSIAFFFETSAEAAATPPGAAALLVEALRGGGAGRLDAAAFQAEADAIGARIDYAVEPDGVRVTLTTLADERERAAALLRLALLRPQLGDAALTAARDRRIDALRAAGRDLSAQAERLWRLQVFGRADAYARVDGEGAEAVEARTAADLRAARDAVFNLRRLRVAAVGPIDAAELGRLLDGTLEGFPADPARSLTDTDVTASGGVVARAVRGEAPTQIVFGHLAPAPSDPDAPALAVLVDVLREARLSPELAGPRGLVRSVALDYAPLARAPAVIGSAELRSDEAAAVISIIRSEWALLAEAGPTDAEVEAAKARLVAQMALSVEDNADLADRLLTAQRDGLTIDAASDMIGRVEEVEAEDVARLARRVLADRELLFVVVGPRAAVRGLQDDSGDPMRRPAARRAPIFGASDPGDDAFADASDRDADGAVLSLDDGFGDADASFDDGFGDGSAPLDDGFGDADASFGDGFGDADASLDDGFGDADASLDGGDFFTRDDLGSLDLDDGASLALDDDQVDAPPLALDGGTFDAPPFGDLSLDEGGPDPFGDGFDELGDGGDLFSEDQDGVDPDAFVDATADDVDADPEPVEEARPSLVERVTGLLGGRNIRAEERRRERALDDLVACADAADAAQEAGPGRVDAALIADGRTRCDEALASDALEPVERAETARDLGVIETAAGDLDAALAAFGAAIDADPSYGEALVSRGILHRRLNRVDRAFEDFTAAIEAEPDYAAAYFNRGRVLRERGDLRDAIDDLTEAVALDPTDPRAHLERGIAFGMQSDFAAAIENFDAAIDLDPDNWLAHQNSGFAYLRAQDYLSAVAAFNEVIRIRPTAINAFELRAEAYEALGELDDAQADRVEAERLRRRGG